MSASCCLVLVSPHTSERMLLHTQLGVWSSIAGERSRILTLPYFLALHFRIQIVLISNSLLHIYISEMFCLFKRNTSEPSLPMTEPEWNVGHFQTLSPMFCNKYVSFNQLSLTTMWRTDCVWASRNWKLLSWTRHEMMGVWTGVKKERKGKIQDIFWRQNRKIVCETKRKGGIKNNSRFFVLFA